MSNTMQSLKLCRGGDNAKQIDQILAICDSFFDKSKWLEVTIKPLSGKATKPQNDMQHVWYAEAEKQGDMTAKEYRADCKAWCGIPILNRDSEEFRAKYNEIIRPLSYEHKLALMVEPFDFPVTRLMNKDQKSEYLDAVYHRLTVEHGIALERQVA